MFIGKKILLGGLMLWCGILLCGCGKTVEKDTTDFVTVRDLQEELSDDGKSDSDIKEDVNEEAVCGTVLAVDALRSEELPQAELLETDRQELDKIEGFTMEVTYATSKGAGLQLTNLSESNIIYGDSYVLQVYQDNKWYELDYIIDNYAFHEIGYELLPNATHSLTVEWSIFHGELPPGSYRIIKDVMDFRGTGDYTEYYVGAEFTVE